MSEGLAFYIFSNYERRALELNLADVTLQECFEALRGTERFTAKTFLERAANMSGFCLFIIASSCEFYRLFYDMNSAGRGNLFI